MKELSIYIHIPFCVRKCLYCDFLSFPVCGDGVDSNQAESRSKISSYVNLLCREIEAAAPSYGEYEVISVFFGGGTPSILSAGETARIMKLIGECYRIMPDAEITIEMNPGTADRNKLEQYITSGINRLSIGLQSTDDEELKRIGRIHDYRTFLKSYEAARQAGFGNINVDLMSALPGQSIDSYRRTLERVTALMPEHISAYSLILEEGTPLFERQAQYRFPEEEEDREMYELTGEYLRACGYHRYEISNYVRPGYECRHNKVYWRRGAYVGFGLGAASMARNIRWNNPAQPEQYRRYVEGQSAGLGAAGEDTDRPTAGQDAVWMPDRQILGRTEQMEEYMFLGLRMMEGVSIGQFAALFGQDLDEVYGGVVDKMTAQKLLERHGDSLRLTARGIDVSNYVMAQFLIS